MTIPKGARNKYRFNPALDVEEVTVIPCGACGQTVTGKCGREAMIFLFEHLRENVQDPKHREELQWLRKEVLSRNAERTDA